MKTYGKRWAGTNLSPLLCGPKRKDGEDVDTVIARATNLVNVKRYVAKGVKKAIYVPNKIVTLVAEK